MKPEGMIPSEWTRKAHQDVSVVPKAGEILYRLKDEN